MSAKKIDFDYTPKTLGNAKPIGAPVFGELERNILYTFSGKSAISLVLRYFRSVKKLRDRTDQLLVPGWLGIPVYHTINQSCFPSTFMNEKVRGVLAYHQWGFPQDMDYIKDFCNEKGLFLVEDCAHSFEGFYKGRRLGTIADAGIFSLAKFFPSVVGGAVYTANADMRKFVMSAFSEDEDALAKKAFAHRLAFDAAPTKKNLMELERWYVHYDKFLKCPDYSRAVAQHEVRDGAVGIRKLHYKLYKTAFGNVKYLSELFRLDTVPWVVPLFFEEDLCRKVVAKLQEANIKSDVYHFDVNRNMLKPSFKICVPVPCHQGMSEQDIVRIISIVQRAVR